MSSKNAGWLFFGFYFAMCALSYVIICGLLSPIKEVDFLVILLFCQSLSFEKNYVSALKEFILFH